MHTKIEKALASEKAAQEMLKRTIRSVVLKCRHTHIAECTEMEGPEWRICMDCGLTDEGWGCGFQILRGKYPKIGRIGRDDMLRIRTVSLWQRNYGQTLEEQIDRFPF